MIVANLDRVSVVYTSEPVFRDLAWEIEERTVVGLVGPNGCGKSTLLRLVAGEIKSETGYNVRRPGLTVGYLAQEPQLASGRSVWEESLAADSALAEVERDLIQTEAQLEDPIVLKDERRLSRTLELQARLLEKYVAMGGPGYEGRVRSALYGLGFTAADLALPVDVLSGGQKKLVGLARLMVTQPDLLLLDEPDNHLDLDGKATLEQFIRAYPGTVILVSHDRYLLDLVVDEIAELEDGRLTRYPGSYSEYAFEKQVRLARQQQVYQAQQKEISRLEHAAKRLLTWGRVYDNPKFTRRGFNIMNRLEKMDKVERPILERRRMALELPGWRGSSKVLEIMNLCKAFPAETAEAEDVILLAGVDLALRHGERVGVLGPNGSGKSLLFRLILGAAERQEGAAERPTDGQITVGPSVQIGYYAQQHENLDYDETLVDTVRQAAVISEEGAVAFLRRFLFTYEQSRSRVGNLSGGERSRLQLALLMLSGANFLLLDEPTNNLDIASAEVLESALVDFEGTVLVISHDRYFLDQLVERIVALDDGALTEYQGGYVDYQAATGGRPVKARRSSLAIPRS
jgi:ATP-binding cassette subfamily F protein 3